MNSFLTCQFSSVTHKVLNLDESEYGITQRQFKSNYMSKGNNHPKYIHTKKQVENQLFNPTWAERILKILYSFRGIEYMNTCSKSLALMIKSSTATILIDSSLLSNPIFK